MKYLKYIDGLRGISILFVLLYHINPQIFRGGFIGVDIFFVISGYLITKKILSNNKFNLLAFYKNRFKRLYPTTLVVLLLSSILSFIFLTPADLKNYSQSVVSTILFSSNILFYTENSYFSSDTLLKPLIHTWSLGVEEQFYILYPIIILAFKKYWKIALKLLALTSILLSIFTIDTYGKENFYLPIFRFWEISIGCLIYIHKDKTKLNSNLLSLIQFLSLLVLFWAAFTYSSSTPFPGENALLIVLSSGTLLLENNHDNFVKKLLGSNFLVRIGKISFSFYMFHQPLFAIYKYLFGTKLGVLSSIALIAISYFLANIFYKLVEQRYRYRSFSKEEIIFTSLLTVFLLSFGLIGHLNEGYKNRLNQFNIKSIEYSGDEKLTNVGYIGSLDKSIVFYGDSSAQQLIPKAAEHLSIYYSIQPGCNSFLKTNNSTNLISNICMNQEAFFESVEVKKTQNLVIAHSWNRINSKQTFDNYINYLNSLSTKLSDKQLFLIGPSPNSIYEGGYLKCLMKRFIDCNEKYLIENSSNFKQNENLKNIKLQKNIIIIDLFDLFCDDFYCYEVIDGNLIYIDGSHTTNFSSQIIVEKIIDLVP